MYLTNCWYAAAWSEDLTDSTPLERQISPSLCSLPLSYKLYICTAQ